MAKSSYPDVHEVHAVLQCSEGVCAAAFSFNLARPSTPTDRFQWFGTQHQPEAGEEDRRERLDFDV